MSDAAKAMCCKGTQRHCNAGPMPRIKAGRAISLCVLCLTFSLFCAVGFVVHQFAVILTRLAYDGIDD